MKKALWLSSLLALTVLGCDDSNPVVGPESTAELRVAHLSPDAPNVDVWVDGVVTLSGVPFQAVSDYLAVSAGSHRIQVTPAGATEPVVIDATLDLAGGTATTVAATGLLADIQPLVLADDRTPTGDANVRFVHASPDAPAVDVAVTGGALLFPNVAFRESDGYTAVPPGTYDLEVRAAGTSMVALPLPGTELPAANVTVFAVGLLGDGSLGALVAVDS